MSPPARAPMAAVIRPSAPPPAGAALTAAPAAGSQSGQQAERRVHVPADRRPFDGRRLKAALLDSILVGLIPAGLLATGQVVTEGAWLVFNAFALIYYFLCEATIGQTVGKRSYGLRVVSEDGTPATPTQVSARTVLRLVDNGFIGLVALVVSGEQRKRLGDFVGRTVVVDAQPDPGRPARSPVLAFYPVAWAGAALAFFFAVGHGGDTYLAQIEDVCDQREELVAKLPQPLILEEAVMVVRLEVEALDRIDPPSERRALHAELIDLRMRWLDEAEKADREVRKRPKSGQAQLFRLARAAAPLDARFARLGLTGCGAPQPAVI